MKQDKEYITKKFGEGTINKVEPEGDDMKVDISLISLE